MAWAEHDALNYTVDTARLDPALREAWRPLQADAATRAWIAQAEQQPLGRARLLWRDLLATRMGFYDANGLAGVGSDWLLGRAQWSQLLDVRGGQLLDIGAGDGAVTGELAAHYHAITTTETAPRMARRLRARGWHCVQSDLAFDATQARGPFDAIALLNVLDRSTHPLRLLAAARRRLAPEGRLIVALPIPLRPVAFVDGARFAPAESLPAAGPAFEIAANALHAQLFAPLGLQLRGFARAPYLNRGAWGAAYQALDDAIFVYAPASP